MAEIRQLNWFWLSWLIVSFYFAFLPNKYSTFSLSLSTFFEIEFCFLQYVDTISLNYKDSFIYYLLGLWWSGRCIYELAAASPWLRCWWRRLRVVPLEELWLLRGDTHVSPSANGQKPNHQQTRRCEWRVSQPEIVKGFFYFTHLHINDNRTNEKETGGRKKCVRYIVKEETYCPSAAPDYLIVFIICS